MRRPTLELDVPTGWLETHHSHQNRRWEATVGARNPRNSGRNRAPRFDSFRQVEEEDKALRLAMAALLGVAGGGGASGYCSGGVRLWRRKIER
jgi:hypothetical protein